MKKTILALALMLTLSACSTEAPLKSTNLMDGVKQNQITPIALGKVQENAADKTAEITDFSLGIFNKLQLGENTLISPLSIISALAMTANGAEKETLAQMENVFGADVRVLNDFLYSYRKLLPTDEKYKVSLANSIWFKDEKGLSVNSEFLQKNKDYYDAEIYKAAFDDSTKEDINAWVKEKTTGQIETLLEEAPPKDAVMYLINALSFDAQWKDIYKDIDIREGEFTTQSGEKQPVEFMGSKERSYIDLPSAVGFTKPYADDKYSFVALLPDENIPMSDFIASLDGEALIHAIKNGSEATVWASIPKFTFEYDRELSDILKELGMTDAFDGGLASFKGLGTSDAGNIYISRVIHKTKIAVDEKGTKAGAVTAVQMAEGGMIADPKEVKLDRPFYFMIVDNSLSLPLFMGVLNQVGN